MSKANHNYEQFKKKQYLSSNKNRALREFNNFSNRVLLDAYDSNIDFAFELFEDLLSTDDGDLLFNKVLDNTKSTSYNISKDFIIEYIDKADTNGNTDMHTAFNLMKIVLGVYYKGIVGSYMDFCQEQLASTLNKGIESLLKEEFFRELMFLDSNFRNTSRRRFIALFKKADVSSNHIADILIEECTYNIFMRLKEPVLDCILTVLNEALTDIEFSEIDLSQVFTSLSKEGRKSKNECSTKLGHIDDYRKLNKLATDSGFKYIRCKGDHGIFKNENGLVVIPQGRSIGKGLSIKIQKAIFSLNEYCV